MSEETIKLTLSLPPDLHKQLVARAEEEERTLNAAIRYAIKRYLSED